MKQTLTQRPWFWILQCFLLIGSLFFATHFYPKAFPLVDLKIKMDRQTALSKAQDLARSQHWGPENFSQTAEFSLDRETQTYAELTDKGHSTFSQLLQEKFYSPYTWRVRHFQEGSPHETYIQFTPAGDFYSFNEIIPENQTGPALSQEEALNIAKNSVQKLWPFPFEDYPLTEKSFITQPNHRVDHFFTFENPHRTLGEEGKYRILLTVRGDRLSGIQSMIKIPESFSRKYAEMRSANQTITSVASVAMLALYILGGCLVGVFLLARQHWVLWKKPLFFGILVSAFQFFDQINHLPLAWMQYDTALSSQQFMSNVFLRAALGAGADALLLTLSFMAAESLSRKAFPHHPQLWKVWNLKNAASPEILGRTLGGYLNVGLLFCYVVAIYLVGTHQLGWWTPSDTLFQPDALASYLPWLTSISASLHAGFWEESLFRAVPIAGAALLGARYGKRNRWIIAGFIIQALIFAAAHANYPAQPSYARVVELILPSIFFGLVYLRFGLLPGIILHFTFDVIFFAIPLFASSSAHVKLDQFLVVFLTFTPLWIVLTARFTQGGWKSLDFSQWNAGWTPPSLTGETHTPAPLSRTGHALSPSLKKILISLGLIGTLAWIFIPFPYDSWRIQLTRSQAIEKAREVAQSHGFSSDWEAHPVILTGITEEHPFIWRTESQKTYSSLLGQYLSPPLWGVRFLRHDREVSERAEEFHVTLTEEGRVYGIKHSLPEGRPGASLSEAEAKTIALLAIEKNYGLTLSQLKPISSQDSKLLHRKDWSFIFQDPSIPLHTGEARILVVVSGDEVTAMNRYVFAPEEWTRKERNRTHILSNLHLISWVFLALLFLISLVHGIIRWTKKQFHFKAFQITALLIFILEVTNTYNMILHLIAHLSTVAPKLNQLLNIGLFTSLKIIATSLAFGVIAGLIFSYTPQKKSSLSWKSLLPSLAQGMALSALSLLILTAGSHLFPRPEPTPPFVDPLAGQFLVLTSLNTLERFIQLSLFFLVIDRYAAVITQGWQKRKVLASLGLILLGLAIIGIDAPELKTWITLGLPLGGILYFLYRFIFWYELRLIPVVGAGLLILGEYRHLTFHAFPGSTLYSLLNMSLLYLGAMIGLKVLHHSD